MSSVDVATDLVTVVPEERRDPHTGKPLATIYHLPALGEVERCDGDCWVHYFVCAEPGEGIGLPGGFEQVPSEQVCIQCKAQAS